MSEHAVLFARHGECVDAVDLADGHPRSDSPLTRAGREQARALAGRLPPGLAAVVSSPLARARETAAIVSEASGLALLPPLDVLEEWRAPSCILGVPRAAQPADYEAWRVDRFEEPWRGYEDGESLEELHARARLARARLVETASAVGPILVVAHKMLMSGVINQHLDAASAFRAAMNEHWENCAMRWMHSGRTE